MWTAILPYIGLALVTAFVEVWCRAQRREMTRLRDRNEALVKELVMLSIVRAGGDEASKRQGARVALRGLAQGWQGIEERVLAEVPVPPREGITLTEQA